MSCTLPRIFPNWIYAPVMTNAPSTFQVAMNKVFQPYLRRFLAVFFDDILIYSKSIEKHIEHLQIVLKTFESQCFYAKLSKCLSPRKY